MRCLPAFAALTISATGLALGAGPVLGARAFLGAQPTTQPTAPPPARIAPGPAIAPQPTRDRAQDGTVLGPSRAGWWNDTVFYEIFVRSFKDSTTGPLAGDGVGDLNGIIEKLDYLNDGDPKTTTDLGVTGLWLMPINPSPSYHGYDVTDYCAVQEAYGSIDNLRRLVRECHRRGIRIILDLVLNHCSSEHAWFKAAADPASDRRPWFIWSETDPGWKGPWGQRVWHPLAEPDGRKSWYYGLFSPRMPDLNYRTPAVSEEMLRVVRWWIADEQAGGAGAGVDGYRLDAIRHLVEDGQVQENTLQTHAWLRKFRAELKRAIPSAVSIGEVWSTPEIASSYVAGGDELDMAFEFDLAGAMVEAASTGKAKPVVDAQSRVLRCYPPNQYGRFLTNHDQTRVMTALKGDAGAMRAAAAMLLLGPGVPFIYYGEEIGMTGDKPDENLRRPMRWSAGENAGFTGGTPWEPMGAEATGVNVEAQTHDPDSLWSFYSRLISLRAAHPALASGGFAEVRTGNPGVYAFLRTGEEPVLVVINLTAKGVKDYALECAGAPLNDLRLVRDLLRDLKTEGTTAKPLAEIGAHEPCVFALKKPDR